MDLKSEVKFSTQQQKVNRENYFSTEVELKLKKINNYVA